MHKAQRDTLFDHIMNTLCAKFTESFPGFNIVRDDYDSVLRITVKKDALAFARLYFTTDYTGKRWTLALAHGYELDGWLATIYDKQLGNNVRHRRDEIGGSMPSEIDSASVHKMVSGWMRRIITYENISLFLQDHLRAATKRGMYLGQYHSLVGALEARHWTRNVPRTGWNIYSFSRCNNGYQLDIVFSPDERPNAKPDTMHPSIDIPGSRMEGEITVRSMTESPLSARLEFRVSDTVDAKTITPSPTLLIHDKQEFLNVMGEISDVYNLLRDAVVPFISAD